VLSGSSILGQWGARIRIECGSGSSWPKVMRIRKRNTDCTMYILINWSLVSWLSIICKYFKNHGLESLKGNFLKLKTFFMYNIQHCFICHPSDSTVSEDAGIEPRTVATTALAVIRSNHSARSYPQSARSHPLPARFPPQSARKFWASAEKHYRVPAFRSWLGLIYNDWFIMIQRWCPAPSLRRKESATWQPASHFIRYFLSYISQCARTFSFLLCRALTEIF